MAIVEEEVFNELAPLVCKGLDQDIFRPCLEPRFDGVDQSVAAVFVLDVEELAGLVAKLVGLAFELRREDEPRLK